MTRLFSALCVCACLPLAALRQTVPAQRPGDVQANVERTGGTSVISPSVLASSSARRDASGLFTVDILILWRGSPGWSYRRTGFGGLTSGGSSSRDGTISFSIQQGGLLLTAIYDPAAQTATILGERVELKGANVVLVDRVDGPDGPVIAGATTVPARNSTASLPVSVPALVRDTPELLAYLRCEAQLPEPINQVSMNPVCAEAMFRGLVKAPRTVTPVPTGPVTNRAAATGPPARPQRPASPGESSGSGVISPVVVAGWFTSRDRAGTASMDLLVLWRGSLGWAMKGESSSSSGGSSVSSRRGMTIRRGDRSLYAAFEAYGPRGRTAQIEDTTIELGEHNVVLVDDVDSAGGPRVVKTLRVVPTMSEERRIDPVIAGSPELVAYLRCDLKLPDARQQVMMNVICTRFTGK